MKIFIVCSKHFYDRVEDIKKQLEQEGHIIQAPNSFEDAFKEEKMKLLGKEEHIKWKQGMLKKDEENIEANDAILVLNFEKHGQENYIGGATFMEIVEAWKRNKKIYFYNPIPKNIFEDELIAIDPMILNGDLSKIQDSDIKNETIKQPKKKPGAGFGVMILNNEGKVLLGRRHEDPDKADSEFRVSDVWTMPGGKLEFGETFEQGAKREVLEETGLILNNVSVICLNNDMNEYAHFVTVGLFSDKFEGSPKVMEPDEITEWKWFELNNLPENIYFPSVKIIENYLQEKFYISPKQDKRIEVELQTFLSKDDYDRLVYFFNENAEFIREDFQETYYFDEESNLRIQRNNDFAKLWHKTGKVHDEFMEEIEVKVKRDDFEDLERFLNKLGHEVKIKWFRERKQFDWKGIKICLDFTRGYGYILELEKMSNEQDKEIILEELRMRLDELNIPLTPKEEFAKKYNYYKEHWRELI